MPKSKGPRQGTRRKLSNNPRDRGTSPPQRAIKVYEPGQKVHLKIDPSVPDGRFHPRFNGKTGEVTGKQGKAYTVSINDGGKEKTLIVTPAHMQAQESATSVGKSVTADSTNAEDGDGGVDGDDQPEE